MTEFGMRQLKFCCSETYKIEEWPVKAKPEPLQMAAAFSDSLPLKDSVILAGAGRGEHASELPSPRIYSGLSGMGAEVIG